MVFSTIKVSCVPVDDLLPCSARFPSFVGAQTYHENRIMLMQVENLAVFDVDKS